MAKGFYTTMVHRLYPVLGERRDAMSEGETE
jgi:hypothetical protein